MSLQTFVLLAFMAIAMAWGCAVPEASHGGAIHCVVVRLHQAECKDCPAHCYWWE